MISKLNAASPGFKALSFTLNENNSKVLSELPKATNVIVLNLHYEDPADEKSAKMILGERGVKVEPHKKDQIPAECYRALLEMSAHAPESSIPRDEEPSIITSLAKGDAAGMPLVAPDSFRDEINRQLDGNPSERR